MFQATDFKNKYSDIEGILDQSGSIIDEIVEQLAFGQHINILRDWPRKINRSGVTDKEEKIIAGKVGKGTKFSVFGGRLVEI